VFRSSDPATVKGLVAGRRLACSMTGLHHAGRWHLRRLTHVTSSTAACWLVRVSAALTVLLGAGTAPSHAGEPFSFSKDAEQERAAAQAEADAVATLVSVPCQQRLKDRKILLLIAERTESDFDANQDRYGPHFRAIESRLRALGLRPYTQEQIRAQIAQAEVDAYFRNDPDAAIAASRRLAAHFVLRGDILTMASVNPVLGINEVAVSIGLALSDARTGRVLSEVTARSEAFSGADPLGTALELVQRQANVLVARIYNDFCQNAEAGGK
jgi:hypothetical protein